jgi:hypothetical protein
MDEAGYINKMRREKKSERTVTRYTNCLRTVADFLWKHKRKKRIDDITPKDVKDFESWGDKKLKNFNQHIWALKIYAEYTANHELEMLTNECLGARYAAEYKLKDFLGIDPKHLEKLKLEGIKTVKHMLDAGRTISGRKLLSKETGVPLDTVLELVKLSDLARIPGLKKIRARLYYDAGLDTVEKIAKLDPGDLIQMLRVFIKRSGFNGIAPMPKEAATSVATAKYIAKIVEY